MSRHAVRAKIRHKNSDIHLGYYATKTEAMAAQKAAHAALDKWDKLHPLTPAVKRKMPSISTLIHFINMGTYDPVVEELAEASTGRYHLIKRHKNKGLFPSADVSPSRTMQASRVRH